MSIALGLSRSLFCLNGYCSSTNCTQSTTWLMVVVCHIWAHSCIMSCFITRKSHEYVIQGRDPFAISDLLVLALCSNVCNSICPSLPGSLLTKHLTWAFVTRHHSIIYYSSWRTDFGSQSTVYMTCCSDTTAYVLSPAFSTRIAIICETFQLTRIYWQRCGQVLGFLEGESLHVKLLKITTSWTVAKCFNCQICPVSFQCQVTPIMITYSAEYIQTLSSFQSWNTPFATPIRPVQIVTRGRLLVANSIKFRIYPLFITYSSWL